jgi:hypothetical protein
MSKDLPVTILLEENRNDWNSVLWCLCPNL